MSAQTPLHVFRFQVEFAESGGNAAAPLAICNGAFAECAGLEATMEPFIIREGGRPYGAIQRVGAVTFPTVILRRGMTTTRHLWRWFHLVTAGGAYAFRLDVSITMLDMARDARPTAIWKLARALPIKFKSADLNALSTALAIEELHLAHEGLSYEAPRS